MNTKSIIVSGIAACLVGVVLIGVGICGLQSVKPISPTPVSSPVPASSTRPPVIFVPGTPTPTAKPIGTPPSVGTPTTLPNTGGGANAPSQAITIMNTSGDILIVALCNNSNQCQDTGMKIAANETVRVSVNQEVTIDP